MAYIKPKVSPTELEKEVVSVLEETWVNVTPNIYIYIYIYRKRLRS
jgi:hypothetical protein